jgi:hypothetical protein
MTKSILAIVLLIITFSVINAQENNEGNYFQNNFQQRIILGLYDSYYADNIGFVRGGYEAVLELIHITPEYNLIDFGFGLNALMAFDNRGGTAGDRPFTPRFTIGFDLYYAFRIYSPLIKNRIRVFLEPFDIGLVIFTRPYPETVDATGTYINVSGQYSLGVEYKINQDIKGFMMLQLFHASNAKEYINNPALEGIGILMGLQF